jgi:Spy/CpxP family protein refolding chaperone
MRRLSLLAASFLAAGCGIALADPAGHGFHHGEDFLRGVSLTEAQRDQVKQIEQAGWTQARAGFEQMRGVHEQIMARLLSPGSVSEADLAPLVQQEQALRAQMDEQRLARALAVRQVLTPQQLAEAAAKHQQIESLHQQEHQLMEPPGQE